jgi:hypothetical protein
MLSILRDPSADLHLEVSVTEAESSKEAKLDGAPVTWDEVFSNRRALLIGCSLNLASALSGYNS